MTFAGTVLLWLLILLAAGALVWALRLVRRRHDRARSAEDGGWLPADSGDAGDRHDDDRHDWSDSFAGDSGGGGDGGGGGNGGD